MRYFSYHNKAKELIKKGRLIDYYFCAKHNNISPALILIFNDATHPVMPLRNYRWSEYAPLLAPYTFYEMVN
ncbi:MAG: thermostable hemolysin delta-VPH [Clostridia bacterium]|jgi:hypothetical protein|nr:thermostable hemolysin delta-VPH [Clostridia bacterium]